ncbi:hypothetical protein ABZY16_16420 [Streptomyces sp. NPDC006553]|uniref:hypothetical protein n=1 Tax=Streptomyces sp. NPDC006553 TaxID=3157180 RepID=UPI0033ABBAAB
MKETREINAVVLRRADLAGPLVVEVEANSTHEELPGPTSGRRPVLTRSLAVLGGRALGVLIGIVGAGGGNEGNAGSHPPTVPAAAACGKARPASIAQLVALLARHGERPLPERLRRISSRPVDPAPGGDVVVLAPRVL